MKRERGMKFLFLPPCLHSLSCTAQSAVLRVRARRGASRSVERTSGPFREKQETDEERARNEIPFSPALSPLSLLHGAERRATGARPEGCKPQRRTDLRAVPGEARDR